jgi:hypothetical protein
MPRVFKHHSDVDHSDINKYKIKNWTVKKGAEWEKPIQEAKLHIGLWCHLIRKRRRS